FRQQTANVQLFDRIVGYDGIKRTFVRSLTSKEPVHILLVGLPGQAKSLFLKCILETFGEKNVFFTVGGNASKSGLIDVLFDMRPKYLLVDEIEHLKPEYQTSLLSLMETWILTQTMRSKVRHIRLKTWVFATSNGTKKRSDNKISCMNVPHTVEQSITENVVKNEDVIFVSPFGESDQLEYAHAHDHADESSTRITSVLCRLEIARRNIIAASSLLELR
ncbi:MAG: hypothetical protein WAM14_17705, partial [Candidatus Nitrosopolaris sp.]